MPHWHMPQGQRNLLLIYCIINFFTVILHLIYFKDDVLFKFQVLLTFTTPIIYITQQNKWNCFDQIFLIYFYYYSSNIWLLIRWQGKRHLGGRFFHSFFIKTENKCSNSQHKYVWRMERSTFNPSKTTLSNMELEDCDITFFKSMKY